MSQRSGELLLKAIRGLTQEEQDEVLIAILSGQGVGAAHPMAAGAEGLFVGEPYAIPLSGSHVPVPMPQVRVQQLRPAAMGEESALRVLPVRLPADAYERLRAFAKEHDFSMAVIIRTLVERFLEGQASPEAPPAPSPA